MNTQTSFILKLVALAVIACVPLSGECGHVTLDAQTDASAVGFTLGGTSSTFSQNTDSRSWGNPCPT